MRKQQYALYNGICVFTRAVVGKMRPKQKLLKIVHAENFYNQRPNAKEIGF